MKSDVELRTIRKLLELINDKNNHIKTFRDLVDYVIYIDNDYLEIISRNVKFFVWYLDTRYIKLPESKDKTREQFLRAIEEMNF